MLLINEVSFVSLQLSGLSNDRSYYLNLIDHVLFSGNMRISVNEKRERIRYVLVVITLNINQNTW